MQISYENTLDHAVAWNDYCQTHSKTFTRNRRIWRVAMSIVYAAGAGWFLYRDMPVVGLTIAFVGLYLVATFDARYRRRAETFFRRVYSEGENNGFLGPHELTLDDGALVEKSSAGESRQFLSSIEAIEETDDFVFVRVQALGAHVIPRTAISEDRLASFVAELKKQWEQRRNNRTPEIS